MSSEDIRTLSSCEVSSTLEEKVYLLFCALGSAKRFLSDCTTPAKFFDNYATALKCLRELVEIEKQNRDLFYEPYPSEQLSYLQNSENYVSYVNHFIERHWYKVLNEARRLKTDQARHRKIESFQTNLAPFSSQIPIASQELINTLSSARLNINDLPRAPQVQLRFDAEQERTLIAALQQHTKSVDRHYCYNDLIDFYYKYRKDYPQAVFKCIKYCVADIESLPSVESEYIAERISAIQRLYRNDIQKQRKFIEDAMERGFTANLPAFDRITMLYLHLKDYDSAIYYCKAAIANRQDYNQKYTKRIERIKRSRAAEEKRIHGSPLLHQD